MPPNPIFYFPSPFPNALHTDTPLALSPSRPPASRLRPLAVSPSRQSPSLQLSALSPNPPLGSHSVTVLPSSLRPLAQSTVTLSPSIPFGRITPQPSGTAKGERVQSSSPKVRSTAALSFLFSTSIFELHSWIHIFIYASYFSLYWPEEIPVVWCVSYPFLKIAHLYCLILHHSYLLIFMNTFFILKKWSGDTILLKETGVQISINIIKSL